MSASATISVPSQDLRTALGMFPTGVTIITALTGDGRPAGLTANSFSSVSLDPPLVAWSLNNQSRSRHVFESASHFAVNVLSLDQRALAERFASKLADPFEETAWRLGEGGSPLIAGAIAVFECSVHDRFHGGDHVIYLGQVRRLAWNAEAPPLVFSRGKFCQGLQAL